MNFYHFESRFYLALTINIVEIAYTEPWKIRYYVLSLIVYFSSHGRVDIILFIYIWICSRLPILRSNDPRCDLYYSTFTTTPAFDTMKRRHDIIIFNSTVAYNNKQLSRTIHARHAHFTFTTVSTCIKADTEKHAVITWIALYMHSWR